MRYLPPSEYQSKSRALYPNASAKLRHLSTRLKSVSTRKACLWTVSIRFSCLLPSRRSLRRSLPMNRCRPYPSNTLRGSLPSPRLSLTMITSILCGLKRLMVVKIPYPHITRKLLVRLQVGYQIDDSRWKSLDQSQASQYQHRPQLSLMSH